MAERNTDRCESWRVIDIPPYRIQCERPVHGNTGHRCEYRQGSSIGWDDDIPGVTYAPTSQPYTEDEVGASCGQPERDAVLLERERCLTIIRNWLLGRSEEIVLALQAVAADISSGAAVEIATPPSQEEEERGGPR